MMKTFIEYSLIYRIRYNFFFIYLFFLSCNIFKNTCVCIEAMCNLGGGLTLLNFYEMNELVGFRDTNSVF